MAKHAAVPRRRVTTRRVVAGTALLVVSAGVLLGALTSRNAVSAGTHASAAVRSGTPIGEAFGAASRNRSVFPMTAAPATGPAALAAPIALLETSRSAALPAAAGPPAAQPIAPATPEPTPTPVEQAAAPAPPAPAPVSTPEAAPAPPPPSTPEPALAGPSAQALVTGRTMYATEAVNVRDAPGTNGTSVLVTLNAREQVTAGDAVDGWLPVHVGEQYGWVKSGYLADGTPPEPAPAAAAPAPPAASSGNWMEALVPQVDPNGMATWVFRRNGGWGASDGHTNYIDPNVPADKRFSVMVHELSHVMQVQVYGSLGKSVAAMSAITGSSSSDVSSNEKTADCMALMLGASWINYGCPNSLRGAASAILAGHRP
jgi:uncharacterized protein YgiM (DUF1202 family)